MTGESIGRALKRKRGLSAESVVRLAVLNGEDPLTLLEAAGYQDFANLLREAFGSPAHDRLTRKQRDLLADVNVLTDADRAAVVQLVKSLAAKRRK